MTKYMLSAVVLVAMLFVSGNAPTANAQGVHFGGGGVHVDVGYPHGDYGHYYPQTTYWGGGWGGWGGHSDWQNTTHLDYHPGSYVPHHDHYDYSPGHFDTHSSGHWDSHF